MALRVLSAGRQFQIRGKWFIGRVNSNELTSAQWKRSVGSLYSKERFGWRTWRSTLVAFLPVGACLVAVMQWRAYRRAAHTARPWEVRVYCALPLRAFSRGWGWLSECQLPEFVRPFVLGLYASSFGVDVHEAASENLKDYPSLADFFSRALRPGVRPVDETSCLTAPCDGRVLYFGTVDSCSVEQVKGVTYSLRAFLEGAAGDKTTGEQYRRSLLLRPEQRPTTLYQCTLYLAPGDYHRFHSPAEWQPEARRHFCGELLSVNPRIARFVPGLFTLNERAVYVGRWLHGFFSFTAVGATNVGSVRVYFDDKLRTNCTRISCPPDCAQIKGDVRLRKGDAVGEFRMGSTIVLIFEAPINFEFNLAVGQRVRVGQAMGCFRQVAHVDQVQGRTNAAMSSAA